MEFNLIVYCPYPYFLILAETGLFGWAALFANGGTLFTMKKNLHLLSSSVFYDFEGLAKAENNPKTMYK